LDPAWPFSAAAPAGVPCVPWTCTAGAPGVGVSAAGVPAAGVPAVGLTAVADAGPEAWAGPEDAGAGDVPGDAGPEPAGEGAGRVAVGVLAGASAVGTGEGVAVAAGRDAGDCVAVMAGKRAEGTADAEAEALTAGRAPGLPLRPALGFLSRFWPGASSRPCWPVREATTGRDLVSTAGAAESPGSGVPSSAWDADAPVDRTSTAPIAAAAAPRRIPPWIPVRDIKNSDLCWTIVIDPNHAARRNESRRKPSKPARKRSVHGTRRADQ